MSTTITLQEIYDPIQTQLADVRGVINQIWNDALSLVKMDMGDIAPVGGKMLRPALCLMSAGAIGGKKLEEYVRLASAFEALHIASLAHDDVIDRALLRRGKTSLNGLWNNHAAVLGGDYLVARAVEMLAEYNSCEVISNAITSVRRMAEGELYFFAKSEDPITREDCILLAEQKTASLFAEACSAPSFLFGEQYRNALHRFGTCLGIAFQIVDDLIDLTQTSEELGKPSCGDIVEAKKTIPIMIMADTMNAEELAKLRGMKNSDLTDSDHQWIAEMMESSGALEKTEAIALEYTDEAAQSLAPLPDSPYKDAMCGILDFVLIRTA